MDILIFLEIKEKLEHDLKRIADLKRLLDDELDQVHADVSDALELFKKSKSEIKEDNS